MSARILIIEDEVRVAHAIERGLAASGFDGVVAITGEEGYFLLSSQAFDLVILDLMLPGRDGLEILRTVRDFLDGNGHLEHDLPAVEAIVREQAELEPLACCAYLDQARFGAGLAACAWCRAHRGEAAVPLQRHDTLEDRIARGVVSETAARDAAHHAVVDRRPLRDRAGVTEVEQQQGR